MSETLDILAPHQRPILAGFALSNVLLAFDFDGTLAPIAATPDAAQLRPKTQQLLARLSQRYPCVVISGRGLTDIESRVQEVPLWYVFGNHGFEPVNPEYPLNGRVAEWLRTLREQLPAVPGIVIEDKSHTLTIHYRAAEDREGAAAAIHGALQALDGARVVGGTEAINVMPHGVHKGVALRRAMELFACSTAIYVGDDGTDEDAFGAVEPERLLAIRVGMAPEATRARFHLARQTDIDLLLRVLVDFRATQFARRPHAARRRSHHTDGLP
jgi:trehalose 6-phosphate phosphatase